MTLNYKEIQEALAHRQAFTGNSMSARWHWRGDFSPQHGRLYEDEIVKLEQAWKELTESQGLYVVYSYATPIAWAVGVRSNLGITIYCNSYLVEQKFSVTTSKGQGYVRRNIDRYAAREVFSHEEEAV